MELVQFMLGYLIAEHIPRLREAYYRNICCCCVVSLLFLNYFLDIFLSNV